MQVPNSFRVAPASSSPFGTLVVHQSNEFNLSCFDGWVLRWRSAFVGVLASDTTVVGESLKWICQEIYVGVLVEEHLEKQETGLGRAGSCIVEFVVVVAGRRRGGSI